MRCQSECAPCSLLVVCVYVSVSRSADRDCTRRIELRHFERFAHANGKCKDIASKRAMQTHRTVAHSTPHSIGIQIEITERENEQKKRRQKNKCEHNDTERQQRKKGEKRKNISSKATYTLDRTIFPFIPCQKVGLNGRVSSPHTLGSYERI